MKEVFSGDGEANFDPATASCVLMRTDGPLPAVCSSLATQGSEATLSFKPTVVTGSPAGPSSAEDLQSSLGDDDDLEVFEDHAGGENHGDALPGKIRRRSCTVTLVKSDHEEFPDSLLSSTRCASH